MSEHIPLPYDPPVDHNLYPALYVPGTMPPDKIVHLMEGGNPDLHRMVICTEDSVAPEDVDQAITNIEIATHRAEPNDGVSVFVRARDYETLRDKILTIPSIDRIDGIVVPKAHPANYGLFAGTVAARESGLTIMPIMEHRDMADRVVRKELLQLFSKDDIREQIACLRLGANDLMGYQSIRRDTREFTIWDSVVGKLMSDIINEARNISLDPIMEDDEGDFGFTVTAPVFECYGERYRALFEREVRQNIFNQLLGQTVIHPSHLSVLNEMYKVDPEDLQSAIQLVGSTKAVNGNHERMDEKTTHHSWAETIIVRAKQFGVCEPVTAK